MIVTNGNSDTGGVKRFPKNNKKVDDIPFVNSP